MRSSTPSSSSSSSYYKPHDLYTTFNSIRSSSTPSLRPSLRRRKPYSAPPHPWRDSFASKRSYTAHTLSSSGTSTRSKTSSLRSLFSSSSCSTTSSSRRKKIISKMKQPFETSKTHKWRGTMTLQRHKKPSTLDFRCIGEEEGSGWMETLSEFATTPVESVYGETYAVSFDEAPKIRWEQPRIHDDWDNWFAGIC